MLLATCILLLGLLAATIVAVRRGARRQALARLRADWGNPRRRPHRLDAIARSHRSRVAATGTTAFLDDRTWADLDLDDVFLAIDHTESTLGQHALYHRLRTAPAGDALDAFEALVTRFAGDAALRGRTQLAVARLGDPQGYDLWWLNEPAAVDAPAWYIAFPLLAAVMLGLVAVVPAQPQLVPLLVASVVVNVVTHLATYRRIAASATAFRQLAPVVATGQALQFLAGDDIAPIVGTLSRDVHDLSRLKTISRWLSSDPLMLSASPHPLAVIVADLVNVVYEYLNLALPLDGSGLYFGAADLRTRGVALVRVIAAIGDVDAAISVASWRAGRADWVRPQFVPAGEPAVITGAWHPLVRDAVPNSVTLPPGRGLLVTGSNMSGKSTLLRTVGVAAVLAQSIHTAPATGYAAPLLHVRSAIGRTDDILTGRSYYVAEVEALLALVRASEEPAPHLFLLDELFRGTNAVERIAAGMSVLVELVTAARGSKPHVVLAATHDTELVDLLLGTYAVCHFGDALDDDGLRFDYRLKPGRATSRNAIALLRLHGAPGDLVERALACATALDRQRDRT